MKVWEIPEFGLDNLRMADRPEPRPGPGDVLVEVRACSLNYRDVMVARGEYDPRQGLPLVPLSDGVGEVVNVGEGVERVAVGDRVASLFAQRWIAGTPGRRELRSTLGSPQDGMLAQRRLLSEEGVVQVPDFLTDVEAATLPCAALTAWSALVTEGRVSPGDTILVQGTGGVATFALQLGLLLGARVIVTSSSDDKLERVRDMGAWKTINYVDTPAWGKAAKALTGGRGVDLVVEVGGAGTMDQSIRAVRPGGTIALIGVLAGGASRVDLTPVLMRGIRVQGVFVGSREGFEEMLRAVEHHELRPVVDRVFPFENAADAFTHLASGAHRGKVCISVP